MSITSITGTFLGAPFDLQVTSTDATTVPTPATPATPVFVPPYTVPSGYQLTAAELAALPDGSEVDIVGADGSQRRLMLDDDIIYTNANKGVDANSATILAPIAAAAIHGQHNPCMYLNFYSSPATEVLTTAYSDQSDNVLMMANAVVEDGPSGSDMHALTIDKTNGFLIEADTYVDTPATASTPAVKTALAIAAFDLVKPRGARPRLDTSADAAGLPMAPFVLGYKETIRAAAAGKPICHPLRFTLPTQFFTRLFRAPGTHYATNTTVTNGFPYGGLIRLKPTVDLTQFSPQFQPIAKGLALWGAYAADNGGAAGIAFFQMDNDPNWTVPFTFAGNASYYYNDDFHKLMIGTMFDLIDTGPDYGDAPDSTGAALPVISGTNPYTLANATGAFIVDGLPLHMDAQPFALKSGQTLTCYNNNPVSRVSVTAP